MWNKLDILNFWWSRILCLGRKNRFWLKRLAKSCFVTDWGLETSSAKSLPARREGEKRTWDLSESMWPALKRRARNGRSETLKHLFLLHHDHTAGSATDIVKCRKKWSHFGMWILMGIETATIGYQFFLYINGTCGLFAHEFRKALVHKKTRSHPGPICGWRMAKKGRTDDARSTSSVLAVGKLVSTGESQEPPNPPKNQTW